MSTSVQRFIGKEAADSARAIRARIGRSVHSFRSGLPPG